MILKIWKCNLDKNICVNFFWNITIVSFWGLLFSMNIHGKDLIEVFLLRGKIHNCIQSICLYFINHNSMWDFVRYVYIYGLFSLGSKLAFINNCPSLKWEVILVDQTWLTTTCWEDWFNYFDNTQLVKIGLGFKNRFPNLFFSNCFLGDFSV